MGHSALNFRFNNVPPILALKWRPGLRRQGLALKWRFKISVFSTQCTPWFGYAKCVPGAFRHITVWNASGH